MQFNAKPIIRNNLTSIRSTMHAQTIHYKTTKSPNHELLCLFVLSFLFIHFILFLCFQQFFCVFLHENLNRMCFLTHNQRWRQKHSNCLPHATRHFIAHTSSSCHTPPPPHSPTSFSSCLCINVFSLSVRVISCF